MSQSPLIFLSAGEVSGDMHGARLAAEIKRLRPDARLVGVGGPQMAQAGIEILADVIRHSAVGLTENLPHVVPVLQAFKTAKAALAADRPAVVVLIDYQGANMDLAAHARKLGLSTVYYITPQEWLWGFKRGPAKVAKGVDHLLAVFEQEARVYEAAGGRVTYVGHPLLDLLSEPSAAPFPGSDGPTVALLPGSRPQEVRSLLPVFLETARRIKAALPDARLLLPVASGHLGDEIRASVSASGLEVQVVEGRAREVLRASDVAIAASGTVTLEAAILGVPCLAAYKVSAVTAFLARRLLKVKHVTLPNIVAGREVIPEFLQGAANPERMSRAALKLLGDTAARAEMKRAMADVKTRLGGPGAVRRAAEAILRDAGLAHGSGVPMLGQLTSDSQRGIDDLGKLH